MSVMGRQSRLVVLILMLEVVVLPLRMILLQRVQCLLVL